MKKIIQWVKVILLTSAILTTITSCQKDMEETNTALSKQLSQSYVNIPGQIHFTASDLYPEGLAFDKFNNRFLVSSFGNGPIGTPYVGSGIIGAVAYNGDFIPFIQDLI